MRFVVGLLLLLGPVLSIVSCDDTPESSGSVEVEITLRTDTALKDMAEMAVWLNCTSAEGESLVITAEKIADGRYLAHLPENCISASPLIEVFRNGITYDYSSAQTRFMSGKRYEYSLVLGPDGLGPAKTGQEIGGWEFVEIEVTL